MNVRTLVGRKREWRGDGRKPKLSPAQAAELRQWADARKTLQQKAAELGISVSAAKTYINRAHTERLEGYPPGHYKSWNGDIPDVEMDK